MSEEKPATQADLREQHKKWLDKYTPIMRRMGEQTEAKYAGLMKEMIKKVEDMGSADSYFDDHIYRDEVIELIEAALKNLENK